MLADCIELEHGLCRYYLMVSMRTTILDQLLVDLVGSLQVCIIHALISNMISTVTFLVLHVEKIIQRLKQILIIIKLFLLNG